MAHLLVLVDLLHSVCVLMPTVREVRLNVGRSKPSKHYNHHVLLSELFYIS